MTSYESLTGEARRCATVGCNRMMYNTKERHCKRCREYSEGIKETIRGLIYLFALTIMYFLAVWVIGVLQ